MPRKDACLVPGSFDPVTLGHMDVIQRACALYDRVYVAVLINPEKTGCFPLEKRMEFLKKACASLPQVLVLSHKGLLVELAEQLDVGAVIRGVRTFQDWENEVTMARINRILDPELETLILPASPAYEQVSASAVRQIAQFGGEIEHFVPREILPDLENWLASGHTIQ